MPPSTSTTRVFCPAVLCDLPGASGCGDAAVRHRHGLVHAAGGIDRVHGTVGEDQICGHQAVGTGRFGTSTLRRNSQTTSPRWLVPVDSTVTMPRSGLLFDSTTSSTVVCA